MANPADVGVTLWPCCSSSRTSPCFRRGIAAVMMAVRALRALAVELQLVNATITSGVDDLSEKLQAMRDVLPAWPRPRFGHTGRVRASRLMTSSWWVVAGL
jgi:hypothetical protein